MPAAHATHTKSDNSPYLPFWLNMIPALGIMYVVMFSMIDGWGDFHNNLNMFYMAVTMWAPMGILMLLTMPHMFPNRTLNLVLHGVFVLLTVGSFFGTRTQALIDDRQFIDSMVPHHSGAILMCREASLADPELISLCRDISEGQRQEIMQMERIRKRL